ncbi:hypothetical protein CYMTET_17206 [Cymbomonas tetramitiformis]|uniref:Uncharacterized protein n=1 Tax=Cymbomonas tetramitiformis TaxID=36881 RepID=A0AAE0GAK6_9CHLO|nr:hypothetical protein CYMTET_17206 [Cymbomonas tetramitiformis]
MTRENANVVHPEPAQTDVEREETSATPVPTVELDAGVTSSLSGSVLDRTTPARSAWSEETPQTLTATLPAQAPTTVIGISILNPSSALTNSNPAQVDPVSAIVPKGGLRQLAEEKEKSGVTAEAPPRKEAVGISVHGFMGISENKKVQAAIVMGQEEGSLIVEEDKFFAVGCSRKEHVPPGALKALHDLKNGIELLQSEMPWLAPTFYIHFIRTEQFAKLEGVQRWGDVVRPLWVYGLPVCRQWGAALQYVPANCQPTIIASTLQEAMVGVAAMYMGQRQLSSVACLLPFFAYGVVNHALYLHDRSTDPKMPKMEDPRVLLKMHHISEKGRDLLSKTGPTKLGEVLRFGQAHASKDVVELSTSFIKFALDHICMTSPHALMRERPHLRLFEVLGHKFTAMDKEDVEARLLFYIMELSERWKRALMIRIEVRRPVGQPGGNRGGDTRGYLNADAGGSALGGAESGTGPRMSILMRGRAHVARPCSERCDAEIYLTGFVGNSAVNMVDVVD